VINREADSVQNTLLRLIVLCSA